MTDNDITESGDSVNTESGTRQDGGTKNDIEVRHSPEELTRRVVELSQENKKRKLAAQALQAERDELAKRIQEIENSKLDEQGKFKDLYEKTAKELQAARDAEKNAKLSYAKKVITSQFSQAAIQAGCQNTEHLVKFASTLGILEELDVDNESFEVSQDSLKAALEKAQKELPYLFTRTAPVVKDGVPSSRTSKPSLSDIPVHERAKMVIRDSLASKQRGSSKQT